MQIPSTSLRDHHVQQHTAARRHPGTQLIYQADQLQNGQRRESGETFDGRHDLHGTDAGSSIDTTINERSLIEGAQGPQSEQGPYAHDAGLGEDEYRFEGQQSSSEESSEDGETEGDEAQNEGQDQGHDQYRSGALESYRDEAHRALATRGFLGEGDSYPSTTSGPPHELNQWGVKHQLPIDHIESGDLTESHTQYPAKGDTAYQNQPPLARANPPTTGSQAMPAVNIWKKGETVRKTEQRVNTKLNTPGAVLSSKAAPDVSSQPPSYSQATLQASHPAKAAPRQQSPARASQIPHRGARPFSIPMHAPASKQALVSPTAPASALRSAHPQIRIPPKEEPVAHYRSIEQDPVHEFEGPIGDYDTPDLFNMSYDQLRAEDFDAEPRGQVQVLSDEMQQHDLTERLVHVQKNLNAGDQEKFFRVLPTREWEDAGDWFLEQFGSIIHRAKEARQNKRKLARDFENEVEKRYRHVAKRQQNVETALGEMKEKGQGLIPKSPRASKEPVLKKIRSRKR
ncbi:uncharacterized protein N0V89_000737 [Didymosphaeria variabile]|uniref:Extracellular mutant protein 11 C-terminal domain-containing protein n=1 Tax=Didymosphaeria variabile TaxID=1932322 RepID=A0A9W8XXC6_9PLEO|nr:uncharacterized protein N0V89_000737 [Didymosphaeria variabile]KAJ4360177.1 hypothetical protein N0V89_000737 [Didymosphaeria variabile]